MIVKSLLPIYAYRPIFGKYTNIVDTEQTTQSAATEHIVHCFNSFAKLPMDEINQTPIKLEMNLSIVFKSYDTMRIFHLILLNRSILRLRSVSFALFVDKFGQIYFKFKWCQTFLYIYKTYCK